MFFFIMGMLGLCCTGIVILNKMMNDTFCGNCLTNDHYYSHNTYPYYGRRHSRRSALYHWYCFWPSLYGRPMYGSSPHCFPFGCFNCGTGFSGNCGKCGDCKGEGVLIVLVIIVLAVAIVGLVFGMILMGLLGYRIFSRRISVLKKKDQAKYQQIQNYWPLP